MHRLYCKDCDLLFWLRLLFMHGNSCYTRSFALTVVALLQFSTEDARIKLKRLYPTLEM